MTIYICAQAETQLYTQLTGSPAAAGSLLASTMAISGLVEFVVGPSFGKLTDALGRRKFFFVYPVYGLIFWPAMALFPKNYLIVTTGRILGWTLATLCGGTVLVSISLADLCSGVQLGKALADFWSAIGLGILAGQMMGDNIMMYLGCAQRSQPFDRSAPCVFSTACRVGPQAPALCLLAARVLLRAPLRLPAEVHAGDPPERAAPTLDRLREPLPMLPRHGHVRTIQLTLISLMSWVLARW